MQLHRNCGTDNLERPPDSLGVSSKQRLNYYEVFRKLTVVVFSPCLALYGRSPL